MNQGNKVFAIVGGIFGVLGIGMLVGGWFSLTSTQNFVSTSVAAKGTVIDLRLEHSDDSSVYYPLIRFQTQNGEAIEFKSSFGSNPPAHRVGEEVPILYTPDNPYRAQINYFWDLWFATILLLGMGTTFGAVGFGLVLFLISSQKKKDWLLKNGQQLTTNFTGVNWNTSVSVNGKHPYQIESQWLDKATNMVHVFRSENIWFNPEEFVPDNIQVYVDPKNYKKHYMDISFLPKMSGN